MLRACTTSSALLVLAVMAGCGDTTHTSLPIAAAADTSTPPAPAEDAGPSDAEPNDASDAGPPDGGSVSSTDAATEAGPEDGGSSDAGPTDARPSDAGPTDAGPSDAGPSDAGASDGAAPMPTTYSNPVLDVSGDPFCGRFGNAYYLYLPNQQGNGRVLGFRSTDLVTWKSLGAVLHNPDATSTGIWAPEVLARGGKYYLYYARMMPGGNDPTTVGNKDIVVVESTDPTNFDGGQRTVLLDDAYAFIDPSPFVDPTTGELFLVFKHRGAEGSGSEIDIQPMKNPTTLAGSRTTLIQSSDVPNSDHIVEQPMLWREGNTFFLLFSRGDGDGLDYAIGQATASKATGPYTFDGLLFHSDAPLGGDVSQKVISPGSSSIVRDGANRAWMVYRQKKTTQTTFADRIVCIDPVKVAPPAITGKPTKGVEKPAPTPL